MNWQELNKAIENKAIEHLEKHNIEVNTGIVYAGSVGIYKAIMSYLTQEQIEKIVKIHKLEL